MARKIQQLREQGSPLAHDSRVLEIDADVDRFAAIAAITDTEGGKELRKAMRSDIVQAINSFTAGYATLSHAELCAIGAKIDARVLLLQALGNAQTNKEDAEKLLDELTS